MSRTAADRLIGFLALDPTQPGWQDELEEGHQEPGPERHQADAHVRRLSLRTSPDLDHLWEYATRNDLPVLLHTGTTFVSAGTAGSARCRS